VELYVAALASDAIIFSKFLRKKFILMNWGFFGFGLTLMQFLALEAARAGGIS
jgi:hypothetical protein